MIIEKKIKLNNNIYYVLIDVEYKKNEQGSTQLCIKNYKDDYYDGGDFSSLIEKLEAQYDSHLAEKYDHIGFMGDVLYLYDRIPFLSGIRDVYISNNDNIPYSMGYISKSEIDKYINDNNIKMSENLNFKLYDESTWNL